ncbi:MAG: hypothetical protein ACM3W4_10870 [Ignavibacteriales bacterium]
MPQFDDPMATAVILLAVVMAGFAAFAFYGVHRIRQIDRKLDQQKH